MTRKQHESRAALAAILVRNGFSEAEAEILRRAERTLHRWAELECGDSNAFASWAIERDEATGKPYLITYPHNGPTRQRRIADRETGALRRIKAVVSARNARTRLRKDKITPYHQGDPRGVALYLVRASDAPAGVPAGASIDSYYSRGIACGAL